MSEAIFDTDETFPFQQLSLTTPIMMTGGAYFIKYLVNKQTIYIQPPKCKTRQGIIKAGKKYYCDLLFTNENEEFIRWVEELESISQTKLFQNRSKWFDSDLDQHDIESCFTSSLKVFKSGKYYILRVNVPTRLGNCALKLFDESERDIDPIEITDQSTIMTILEVQGIRCSSRNFQIDFEIKQMMMLRPEKLFERCVISPKPKHDINMLVSKESDSFSEVVSDAGKCPEPNELHLDNSTMSPGLRPPDIIPGASGTSHSAPGMMSLELSDMTAAKDDSSEPQDGMNDENHHSHEELPEEDVSNSPIDSMVQNLGNISRPDAGGLVLDVPGMMLEGRKPGDIPDTCQLLTEAQSSGVKESHIDHSVDPKQNLSDTSLPVSLPIDNNSSKNQDDPEHDIPPLPPSVSKRRDDARLKAIKRLSNETTQYDEGAVSGNPIEEVELPITIEDTIQLNTRRDVYYEIYQKAKERAKEDRKKAFASYLEAKRIKKQYNLENMEDSDIEEPV